MTTQTVPFTAMVTKQNKQNRKQSCQEEGVTTEVGGRKDGVETDRMSFINL